MNYQTLTKIVNSLNGNPQSKLGLLRFFHGYNDFDDPRIELTDQKIYQVTWDPLDGSGSIRLFFLSNGVGYHYINSLGIEEKGNYTIEALKTELTAKPPNLPLIAPDLL